MDNLIASKRNITLDCYKGILIILVLIRHVLQYSVADEGGILTNIIWAIQMPGFMLMSGYFAARNIYTIQGISNSILKSIERYLMPFLTWFVLISVFLLGSYDRNVITGLITLINHVDSGLWFLWVIFVLSIIAAICNYFTTTGKKITAKISLSLLSCAVFFGVLLAMVVLTKSIGIFGIKYILYYAVFYGFGWLVRKTESFWKQIWAKCDKVINFICLVVFLAIVFNYDLYRCGDDIISIILRFIAGFAGNVILLCAIRKHESIHTKLKADKIGVYTLEIYATHMYVNNLMMFDAGSNLFTVTGFENFSISLILTVLFTTIIIGIFKSIPITDLLMYGKRQKKDSV
jgi:fucose 4-O-acetylase-like acetyltransferase